ncbi:unnamed protein product [Prunus armeniaca]
MSNRVPSLVLHDKLIEHEAALKCDDTVVAAPVITANVTQTSRSHTSNRGYRSNNSNSNRGSFASRNPSRGSYGPTQPAFTDNSRRSTHMNNTGYRGFCQWCGTQGHSAKRCPQLQFGPHNQLVANPTTHGRSTSSPTWLLDSSASHHVTSNVNTLSGASPYDGPDEIIIGNGSGLGITHVGSTTIPSSSSQSFTLSNVLCDLSMGAVLLRGPNKDDVYEWSFKSFCQPQALVGVVVSPNLWHRRLGHPSHKILQQVLRLSSVNVSSKMSDPPTWTGFAFEYLNFQNDFLRKPGKPLGEDAHFICHDAQTIRVADGVGSWARKGVNAGEYARGLMNHTKKHSHGYNPIICRRRGSKKGVERSLRVVLVEPEYGRVEICVTKTNRVDAEDELEGGRGIVGPSQGKKLLQIFKAGWISIPPRSISEGRQVVE